MSRVSVEYAHIYTNQNITEEHQHSVDALEDVLSTMETNRDTPSLVVMVDDYSFPNPTFDYEKFTVWLESQGYKPDVLFRESQLIPTCDEVFALINDEKLKSQIAEYIKNKKYPCSLFIAAWYLLRLGRLASPLFPEKFQSDELINILPEGFQPFEDKGLRIIRSTRYSDAANHIRYRQLSSKTTATFTQEATAGYPHLVANKLQISGASFVHR